MLTALKRNPDILFHKLPDFKEIKHDFFFHLSFFGQVASTLYIKLNINIFKSSNSYALILDLEFSKQKDIPSTIWIKFWVSYHRCKWGMVKRDKFLNSLNPLNVLSLIFWKQLLLKVFLGKNGPFLIPPLSLFYFSFPREDARLFSKECPLFWQDSRTLVSLARIRFLR